MPNGLQKFPLLVHDCSNVFILHPHPLLGTFSQEALFSESDLLTLSFTLELCSQAHQFSFRLCSQSCCRPLHDHLKYMDITSSALTFHLHLVLLRSPFFSPKGVSLGTGWWNVHSHCCRGTARTWALRPSTDNAHSQFVCATTAHRDFTLPSTGSVLPPVTLVGRGHSLKGSKYVPHLIFQGSVLKLTNPPSLTY